MYNLGLAVLPKTQPLIYNLPEEKFNLLPRNQIKNEKLFRAQYSAIDSSFGTVFYRNYGGNRGNQKVSSNVTEARSLCEEDADFLHLPVPRNQQENDFWLQLAGPQVSKTSITTRARGSLLKLTNNISNR